VSDAAAAQAFEAAAGGDTENPFLHMGLHLAVREQLSIDRPPGVREIQQALAARLGEHDAEHVLMEASPKPYGKRNVAVSRLMSAATSRAHARASRPDRGARLRKFHGCVIGAPARDGYPR